MKKIYTILAAMALVVSASAQTTMLGTNNDMLKKAKKPTHIPQKYFASAQSSASIYMDQDSADASVWGYENDHFIWDFNQHYTSADSSRQYFKVAFDTIYDAYNAVGYPRTSVSNLSIDTIFAFIGQENNSGIDDTLRVKILTVDSRGYPTSTVLTSVDQIIPANSPLSGTNNDWLFSSVVAVPVNYVMFGNRFAVQIEYLGNKMDTAGFIAGFNSFQAPCPNNNATLANETNFSPVKKTTSGYFNANTFVLWTQYASAGILPTASGGNLYYDCNSSQTYEPGTDGANYIQNAEVIAAVTTNVNSINEHASGINMLCNRPNPFNGATTIEYGIENASDVTIEVFDITGKKLMEVRNDDQSAGRHSVSLDCSSLTSGVYFYSLTTNTGKLTNKLIIAE